jgi:hypothetical protein
MSTNISIQIKAAFLLVVFALNTVVGFACAIGVDMGFNTTHHPKEIETTKVHVHADGKKHEHHNKGANHHQHDHNKNDKEKDGCCNDAVIQFSQTDKSLPHPASIINPVFFTSFITSFYIPAIFYSTQDKASIKYFVLGHHPPIPNIRIAIQRFQI